MTEMNEQILELVPQVQNYAWGKLGNKSMISQFYNIQDLKPYAEMWMGTHKKAETQVKVNNQLIPLSKFIGEQLPYLFKVLSIRTALSIQVHPDKKTAEKLHQIKPEIYVDDNHKPEMFYTLSNFKLLCGFRTNQEINKFLSIYYHEWKLIMGNDLFFIHDTQSLKHTFSKIMKADNSFVNQVIRKIIDKLHLLSEYPKLQKLIIEINKQYPNDVGVLALFFLNYIELPKGKVMYLKANVPHAYISGDCLEIMATSDNVIRCGLTAKFRDVDLLCDILDYSYKMPKLLEPYTQISKTYEPVIDFGITLFENTNNNNKGMIAINTNYPMIMLVLEAEDNSLCNNKQITKGKCYLLPKGANKFLGKYKIVIAYKPC